MGQEVVLLARFLAKNGNENEVKKELLSLVEPTRKENGCIVYNFHTEAKNKNAFVFYEIWENNDFLKQHSQTDRFIKCMENVKELLEKPVDLIFLNKQ